MSDTPPLRRPAAAPRPATKKAVIVISSHVVRGSVGNRAAVFALEALGFPVWALQTVTLPWHPGHGPSTRMVPQAEEFDAIIDDLCSAPWLHEVGAILTGYLGDPSQAASIAKHINAVKEKRRMRFMYVIQLLVIWVVFMSLKRPHQQLKMNCYRWRISQRQINMNWLG